MTLPPMLLGHVGAPDLASIGGDGPDVDLEQHLAIALEHPGAALADPVDDRGLVAHGIFVVGIGTKVFELHTCGVHRDGAPLFLHGSPKAGEVLSLRRGLAAQVESLVVIAASPTPAYSLLLLLAPALAMASPPGALLLPDSVQRPSGTGEASLGAYYANIDADGFRLGPAGALLTLEAGTSNVCAAGASALGAPQGAIDDWAMLTTVWGRCSPIQLEDNMLNVGGFLFGGVAWDFAGNFTGVSMACLLYTSPSPRD